MILMKTVVRWSSPDLLDIPFKIFIYFTLINSLEKFEFGLLSIAMMIFSYSTLTQLGVVDWLLYELPKKYALNLEMKELIAQSYTFVFVNQFIFLILVFLTFAYFDNGSWFFRIACATYMVHTIFYNYYLHHRLYLRFKHKFTHLFSVQLVFVISKFFLQLGTLKFIGIYGFLIVEMLIYCIPIYLFRFEAKLLLFDHNWVKNYGSLLYNGVPFFVVILLAIILTNLDKWFIIGSFGIESFATYTLGVFLVTGLMIFPGKVLSIFTQYLKEMFTLERNMESNIVRNFSVNNILIFLLLCLLSIINIWSAYIPLLFPKYSDVLPLIDAFLLSAILNYGVSLTSNTLYLIDKRKHVAKVQLVVVLFYAFLLFLNIYLNLDIVFVVWSMCLALMLQILLNISSLLTFEKIDKKVELYKFLAIVFVSVTYHTILKFNKDDDWVIYYILVSTGITFLSFNTTWENLKYIAKREFSK